jgi:hypothetical protein
MDEWGYGRRNVDLDCGGCSAGSSASCRDLQSIQKMIGLEEDPLLNIIH